MRGFGGTVTRTRPEGTSDGAVWQPHCFARLKGLDGKARGDRGPPVVCGVELLVVTH